MYMLNHWSENLNINRQGQEDNIHSMKCIALRFQPRVIYFSTKLLMVFNCYVALYP